MKETAETLMKRTRSELVEMAEKLGINTAAMAKKNIVDFIIEARKTSEKSAAKGASKHRPEASSIDIPVKAQFKPRVGKKGVMAKRAAIDAQINANQEAAAAIGAGVKEVQDGIRKLMSVIDKKAKEMQQEGAEMLQEGSANMQKGVEEMQESINAQTKLNEKAAAKMGIGIKEMQKEIKEFQSAIVDKTHELQIGVKEMHSGVKEIQNGIRQMETKFGEYRDETANYIRDFYYG